MRIRKIVLVEPGAPGYHVYSRVALPRLGLPMLAAVLRRAGYEDVRIYCEDIAPHRSLVTFAIHKILSYDVFEDMIREWVHSKIAKERESMHADIEKDYQRVADAQVRLGECRKAIYKRIKTEKLRADKLADLLRFRKREFDNLRTDYIKASNKADIYRADAKKYRDIVELLNPGQSSHQKGSLTLCV